MIVLIGITQAPEETEQEIFTKTEGVRTTAIVGPFNSLEEASGWMKFMMARTGAYKHIQSPSSSISSDHWYGFTCECIESKAHCEQSAL
ncbi:hypothetical protein [Desulfosediminicola sp.]|uniref:hypothetical protein n=1 Tax=Desulfosediminicola sp. TaxID=2886825 RepID=UPI003AF2AF33